MRKEMSPGRRLGASALFILALLALCSGVAHAQGDGAYGTPDEPACVAAFEQAQQLRKGGKLLAARGQLEICGNASCPEQIRERCVTWRGEVSAATPSIVIAATDVEGNDTLQVRVIVDGKVVAESLDGRALELDPGAHQLRFEHAGAPPFEQSIVLQQGVRNRSVAVRFVAPAAAAPPPTAPVQPPPPEAAPSPEPATPAPPDATDDEGLSPLVYVGFGIGAAGLLVGAIAGGIAISKHSDIKDQCDTTGCTEDDISGGETVAHVSTVGFVVGGVGAAVGVVALLLSLPSEEAGSARIEPLLGPAAVGLRGSF